MEAYEIPLLCVYVCIHTVAGQRLCKDIPKVTNTQATIEQLLDAVFSVRSMSCQIFFM
jgi:hypothetical protein